MKPLQAKNILFCLLFFLPTLTFAGEIFGTLKKDGKALAQQEVNILQNGKVIGTATTDANGYYNYTETAPYYTGGNDALQTYFENNITYPEDAIDNNVEGTVMVRFTIDEDGTVQNAQATGNKLGYGLDEEAVRVVNTMAAWTPGANDGKQVKAWYTLPVIFRLEQ